MDVEIEAGFQALGRGHQQLLTLGNRPADIIRQSTIGKRDVRSTFEDRDFGVFREAACPAAAEAPPATPPTITSFMSKTPE